MSEAIRRQLPEGAVRWVKPAAMHLTLRFLGETPVAALGDLSAALDEVTKRHSPMVLQLAGTGCFPNCRRPRVLWAGVTPAGGTPTDALLDLKVGIDKALSPLGWEPEAKPFRPHLTVGRIKNPAALAGFEWRVDVPQVTWETAVVHLIESELRPDGPRYTLRHAAGLVVTPGH